MSTRDIVNHVNAHRYVLNGSQSTSTVNAALLRRPLQEAVAHVGHYRYAARAFPGVVDHDKPERSQQGGQAGMQAAAGGAVHHDKPEHSQQGGPGGPQAAAEGGTALQAQCVCPSSTQAPADESK